MFIHEYTSVTSTLFTMCRSLFSLGDFHTGHGLGIGLRSGIHTSEFPF